MKRFRLNDSTRMRPKLVCERLEVRRLLDASAMSAGDQIADVARMALTVDSGMTATYSAASDWRFRVTYTYPYGYAAVLTGYVGAGGAVEIPETALFFDDGDWWYEKVERISESAFSGNARITDISIPSSIKDIDINAFLNCGSLTSISVTTSNGTYASVDGVLYDKALTTLVKYPNARAGSEAVANTVTRIGAYAFFNCSGLTSIAIPGSVATIGDSAFSNCTGLTSVGLSHGLQTLGTDAFANCSGLASIAIPGSVATIGDSAFSNCTGLTSVSLSHGLQTLGTDAFKGCNRLVSITIPRTVRSLGSMPFTGCSGLQTIVVHPANGSYASVNGVLYDKWLKTVIRVPAAMLGEFIMPASTVVIGDSALSNCSGITSVTISEGVTSIGDSAFAGCTSITSTTIPSSVATIRSTSFLNCPNLEALYFYGSPPALTGWQAPWSTGTSFRLSTANGWPYSYPIFEPVDVPAGQSTTAAISPSVSRIIKQGEGALILDTPSNRTGGLVVDGGDVVVRNKNSLGVGLLEVRPGASVHFDIGTETIQATYLQLSNSGEVAVGAGRLFVWVNTLSEDEVRSKLIAGRNGGSWDGASGITSVAAGASGSRAVGYRMDGETLEVAYAAPGDSNLDGVIDILDIGDILSAGKFNNGEPANWTQGDTNYDNVFDIVDLADILGTGLFNEGTYLTQGSASSAAVESGTVTTFDPAMVFAALAAESSSQPTTKRKSF